MKRNLLSSYQRRLQEIEEFKKDLHQARQFERMFKNYIRAIKLGHKQEIIDFEKWFAKNSPQYAKEIGLFNKEDK